MFSISYITSLVGNISFKEGIEDFNQHGHLNTLINHINVNIFNYTHSNNPDELKYAKVLCTLYDEIQPILEKVRQSDDPGMKEAINNQEVTDNDTARIFLLEKVFEKYKQHYSSARGLSSYVELLIFDGFISFIIKHRSYSEPKMYGIYMRLIRYGQYTCNKVDLKHKRTYIVLKNIRYIALHLFPFLEVKEVKYSSVKYASEIAEEYSTPINIGGMVVGGAIGAYTKSTKKSRLERMIIGAGIGFFGGMCFTTILLLTQL